MNDLKKIPHLKLPITFEVDELAAQAASLSDIMVGYELPGEDRTDEEREQYRHNWKGRGLMDFERDSSKGMLDARAYQGGESPFDIQYDESGRARVFTTELGQCLPDALMIIKRLFDRPGRCRLTSMTAGGSLNWHSHCQFNTGNYEAHDVYDLAIVHVPLITNPGVKFGVTKFHHSDHGINPVWQHYAAGECWLLNAWHEHNVINEGDEDRIHLMMYGSLRDPRLFPFIIDGLREYEGEKIE